MDTPEPFHGQTEQSGEKGFRKRDDQYPDGAWLSSRDHVWIQEKRPEGQQSLLHSINQSELYGRAASPQWTM